MGQLRGTASETQVASFSSTFVEARHPRHLGTASETHWHGIRDTGDGIRDMKGTASETHGHGIRDTNERVHNSEFAQCDSDLQKSNAQS